MVRINTLEHPTAPDIGLMPAQENELPGRSIRDRFKELMNQLKSEKGSSNLMGTVSLLTAGTLAAGAIYLSVDKGPAQIEEHLDTARIGSQYNGFEQAVRGTLAQLLEDGTITEDELNSISPTYTGRDLAEAAGGYAHSNDSFEVNRMDDGSISFRLADSE